MKKTMALFLTVFLLFSFTSQTFAIGIVYKNKPIATDVPPQIIHGRTLVPIRAINDALNGETSWDHRTQQITLIKGEMNIKLTIGNRIALVNGRKVRLDVPAQIISSRTFVPLRFVSQHFGHDVEWDSATQTVYIDSDKKGYVPIQSIDDLDFTTIYEKQGVGKYAGYKRLAGYPYDHKYAIYYAGKANSYQVTYEDMKPTSLQEKITWKYQGKSYTNTRSELYEYFSDTLKLESLLGVSEEIMNQKWLTQTFGKTYEEWLFQQMYSQEATRIVDRYLEVKAGLSR